MKMFELVSLFQNKCPELVTAMKQADHNYSNTKINPYHMESDVWTHTMQVCLMAERFQVNYMVKLACLFHDLGKPMAREINVEKERIHFMGHEGASVFLTLEVIEKMGLDISDEDKIHILNMVSHHTNLYKVFETKNPIQTVVDKYIGNKRLLEDLIWLSKCDSLGRFTSQDTSTSENLENILAPALAQLKAAPVVVSDKTCTILVGPPCSGKSTWLKDHKDENAVLLCRDDLIMEFGGSDDYSVCWKAVDQELIDKELLRRKSEAIAAGKSIIVDMTNCSPRSRRQSFGQLPKVYKKQAVVFYNTIETLLARNEKRGQEQKKFLAPEVIIQFVKGFTAPLLDEVDEIVYYINNKVVNK